MGNTPVPIFLPDCDRKHIKHPVIAKLFQDLMYCLRAEAVIMVVSGNGLLDCLLAGDICPIGSAVLIQLPMLTRIRRRIRIDSCIVFQSDTSKYKKRAGHRNVPPQKFMKK